MRYARRGPLVAATAAIARVADSAPKTIEKDAEVVEANRPPRNLPSSGPATPMTCSTEETRPRYASGVSNWTRAPRVMTDTVSAAPATARHASASHNGPARPKRPVAPSWFPS